MRSTSVQPSQDTNLSSVSSLICNPSQDITNDDQPSPVEFDAEPVESDTEPVTLANPASTAGSLAKWQSSKYNCKWQATIPEPWQDDFLYRSSYIFSNFWGILSNLYKPVCGVNQLPDQSPLSHSSCLAKQLYKCHLSNLASQAYTPEVD